ncbi:exonuclease domain-containing protein [Aquimarina gracilis]|uniref:Exonuclease domain-containing protein n=1 Tax=Aquimarina gracilis TaxID=874422 RepID=A0ABU5ZVH9_9FLAO|nr:exonuclease domain-containing protein [Aquimarina gracilis]MEB3345571.1 exonuclease domain-containing protein [Aquimarina gracilis]
MYAILDIETTGGKYNEEGITEIAIYKFDGHEVVDQFISLVNPERPIQPFVANLTGINNEMLRNAPKFYEVAKRIVEITTDCVVVAHNASFDYRILQTEFSRLGFDYERHSLCTVELSKRLIPDQQSYSLGKLVRGLGIPLSDRHRANGDAQATVKLFKLLLAKDSEKNIITTTVRADPKRQIDDKLLRIIKEAPTATGVYYMHREDGKIIYIGKSKNIKKRLNQHFTNDNRKSRRIQIEVTKVTYEITGSELLALLKESEEIKRNRPKYNRALKRVKFDQALYQFIDEDGFINLKVSKADNRKKSITTFSNVQQAKTYMHRWTEEYNLCQKLMGLDSSKGNCFNYTIKQCFGACILIESPEEYNSRAQQLINNNSFDSQDMIIIDHGRDVDEQSLILIEEGKFKGIGYFNLNHQINNIDILRSIITPMQHNRDAQHIIQSYVRTHKKLKIIKLEKND